jgi:hypothetical protein
MRLRLALQALVAAALTTTATAAPAATLSAASQPGVGLDRSRRGGFCWSCDSEFSKPKKWWQWWIKTCTCVQGWEGSCCDQPSTCSASTPRPCAQSRLAEKSHACSAVSKEGPIRVGSGPGLPESLRGVFWLTNQADSSSLMSFAASSDGGGISQGALGADNTYRVRVDGDRTWSFHDKTTNYNLARSIDLVYRFSFDSASPTSMTIHPQGLNLPGDFTLSAEWLLSFTADLYPPGSHTTYKDSVVWVRESAVLGVGIDSATYDLVQVMDEHGEKIEPAFSDWQAYCESDATGEQNAGTIFYHEI